MGQTGQGPMGGGMRITTDDRHTGHRGTQFGPHHMNDALAHFIDFKFFDAISLAVVV